MGSTHSVSGFELKRVCHSVLAAVCLLGCRAQTPTETPAVCGPALEQPGDTEVPEQSLAPGIHVFITPMLEPEPRVAVRLELVELDPALAPALREWSLTGPLAGVFDATIEDAEGPVEFSLGNRDGLAGVELTLARAPVLPLRISYELDPVAAELGQVARIELDDAHFFATGEALVLLPEGLPNQRHRLLIHLDPTVLGPADPGEFTGLPPLRAATSFAVGTDLELEAWPFELRHLAFMMGTLEWARFDTMRGDDRWLGTGPARFDQRWSAAELAGVRSAIDRQIGMPTLEPLVTMLVAGSHAAAEPSFRAELRGRGLVILADQSAIWDAQARMNTAQALVSRWLGGRLRVLLDVSADPHSELWFTVGATRYVAREVLFDLGLLSDDEYIEELNRIELELAASPLRERTLDDLVTMITAAAEPGADPATRIMATDAQGLMVARGAAYMAWASAKIHARVSSYGAGVGVIEALRLLVANAVANDRREFSVAELLHQAAILVDYANPPEAEFGSVFDDVVIRGQRPALTTGSFGPCFVAKPTKLRRFELGFLDTTRTDEAPSFAALDPSGPAARAGLRSADQLVMLDYVAGDPSEAVELTLVRDGQELRLSYQPAGPAVRVVQWLRHSKVAPERCFDW